MENANPDILITQIGNKCDLNDRKVTFDEANRYATSCGLLFFEASAKSGVGVREAFIATMRQIPITREEDEWEKVGETKLPRNQYLTLMGMFKGRLIAVLGDLKPLLFDTILK